MRYQQFTLSLFLIGLSAGSFAQPVLVKSQHQIEEYKLDNGMRVILAPNPKETKVYMNTIYLTGSLNDPKGKGGLAHLLEHLAFKGTKKVPGEEFQRQLDQHTLMTNASTDYYSTKYINILRPEQKTLDRMIYLESQRMDQLVLQEKFVPSEISIVMREREVRMDQPFAVMMDQMWKAAYGNQSLGRLPIGDLNELQSINMQELNRYYRDWYAPNNAILVLSGKFDKAAVLKQIDQNFSPIAARELPKQAQVAPLDSTQMKTREFEVKKGSDLAKFDIYLNGKNDKIKTSLALVPYLYTLQPSGHLYSSMVETGITTNVQSTTWLDQDFNLVFLGAIYAPNHDPQRVGQALIEGTQQNKAFNEVELNRVKNMMNNQADTIFKDAAALGTTLANYAVASNGRWEQYFADLDQVQKLSVKEVNDHLKQFLVDSHRIRGDILPTPEDQKKAMALEQKEPAKTLDQTEAPAPLKDSKVYKKEVTRYVQSSKQHLNRIEAKIQRGRLANGMQYALYPAKTRDDKTYASIQVNFGSAESLFNQGVILDLTSYLLLRASEQYSLQDIADKSIEAGGVAVASASGTGINISISAKSEKFDDFFQYIVDVMKNPKFEQSQFDLIQMQSLSSLDRPYTEPETVAALTISRLLEIYPEGDLRYHFEPELAKKQLQAAKNSQVQDLYKKFFAMNHAQISVTGPIDAQKTKSFLDKAFSTWNSAQPYQRLSGSYRPYAAQQQHVLAEQRQFGNYQALITLPVGVDHPDAAALIVMSYILGDSQLSSRLGQELREKNALVYGFSSGLSLGDFDNVGALTIEANYTAGKSKQVSEVVAKVLNDLLAKGVTEQELEAAKADIMKKRVTSLEDDRNIHRMLNSQLERNRKMLDRAKRDQDFARLSKADVDAVIKKYIKLDQLVEVMADQYGQAKP